jgi:hypothetical protein
MPNFEKSSYILGNWSNTSLATARWQWGDYRLSSSLHCRECLSRQFAYLDSLYNPALQGNWPHSFTYHLLAHNTEDCYIRGDGYRLINQKKLLLCVWDSFGFKLYRVSRAELVFCTPFNNFHVKLSNFGYINWLFPFVVQTLKFRCCNGL